MAIGTSLGAYFDDEFHHQAGINTDPSQDRIDVDPEVDPQSTKPKPQLDILPVDKKMPFPDNRNPDQDFNSRFGNLPPSGILNDLKKPDPDRPLLRRINLSTDVKEDPDSAAGMAATASEKAADALKRTQTGSDLPDINTVPHHDAIEDMGKAVYNAVTLPGDVYKGDVDLNSKEGIERTFNLAAMGLSPVPKLENLSITNPGGGLLSKLAPRGSAAELESALGTYEQRFGMNPEQAANNYHNLPQGENIRFAHHYEENSAPHEWNAYEGMVNDHRRQVPFQDSVEAQINSPHNPFNFDQGPSPFEQVASAARRARPEDETDRALRMIHEALYPEGTPLEHTSSTFRNLADQARDLRQSIPNPRGESFDELMSRLDRQDQAAIDAVPTHQFKDYGKVSVADRGYGSFLFKAGDSKVLPLNVSEREGGKLLYVNWIGDQTYKSVNKLGGGVTRGLIKALAEKYPNAEEIAGFRISGARTGRADTARMRIPGRGKISPPRKDIDELLNEYNGSDNTFGGR